MPRNPRILTACLLLPLLLGGCASARALWPFGERATPAAQPVSELAVDAAGQEAPVLQYWERNTLVVDLAAVAGEGQVVLSRHEGRDWPMRIAFRMQPGSFAMLEVRGAQRVAWPVATAGDAGGAVAVDLPAHVYDEGTPALVVRWGAAGG